MREKSSPWTSRSPEEEFLCYPQSISPCYFYESTQSPGDLRWLCREEGEPAGE